jgi:hypothetical protein
MFLSPNDDYVFFYEGRRGGPVLSSASKLGWHDEALDRFPHEQTLPSSEGIFCPLFCNHAWW